MRNILILLVALIIVGCSSSSVGYIEIMTDLKSVEASFSKAKELIKQDDRFVIKNDNIDIYINLM